MKRFTPITQFVFTIAVLLGTYIQRATHKMGIPSHVERLLRQSY